MSECMMFPNDWAKFLEDYSFRDDEEIYTNGSRLIPVFRVEQLIEHYFATDNNVGNKWIPVSERLPEKDMEDVLAFDGISGFFITFMKTTIHGKRYFVIGHDDVTHWMPLPEPPKEEDNE